jgi:hypothetical protein
VEDLPGERVAVLLDVGLHLDLPSAAGLVGQGKDVEGLGVPPVARDRVAERVDRPSRDSTSAAPRKLVEGSGRCLERGALAGPAEGAGVFVALDDPGVHLLDQVVAAW